MLLQGTWPLLRELDVSGKFLPDEVTELMFGIASANIQFAPQEQNQIVEE